MATEKNIMDRIALKVGSLDGVRVFRQNTGMGWVGHSMTISRDGMHQLRRGQMVLSAPRPLHAGLVKGSSDLIGWTEVEITPEMVGKKVAVFTAIEVKNEDGRPTNDQKIFLANVKAAGGFAGVARNENEALSIINR